MVGYGWKGVAGCTRGEERSGKANMVGKRRGPYLYGMMRDRDGGPRVRVVSRQFLGDGGAARVVGFGDCGGGGVFSLAEGGLV